jgi:putative flippase GtrA
VFVFEINVFGARAVSFLTAASTTWAANRALTFSAPSAVWVALCAEWLRYLVASLIGGAVNYGAFALAITFSTLVRQNPVIGVAIGSAAGMCVNYALYAGVVFRTKD